jgi:hypothetical protein
MIRRKGLLVRALIILATLLALVAVITRVAHRAGLGRHYAQASVQGGATAPGDAEDRSPATKQPN